MKNKNKIIQIMLKKTFTKDQLLIMRKYKRLLAYNIPYAVIDRAYYRYLKNIDDYILVNEYPSYWFRKDRDTFCSAVKLYIEAKKEGCQYQLGTIGYVQMEIVKVSGLNKWLSK